MESPESQYFATESTKAIESIESAKQCKEASIAYLEYQASCIFQKLNKPDEAISRLMISTHLLPNIREYKYYLGGKHFDY